MRVAPGDLVLLAADLLMGGTLPLFCRSLFARPQHHRQSRVPFTG